MSLKGNGSSACWCLGTECAGGETARCRPWYGNGPGVSEEPVSLEMSAGKSSRRQVAKGGRGIAWGPSDIGFYSE